MDNLERTVTRVRTGMIQVMLSATTVAVCLTPTAAAQTVAQPALELRIDSIARAAVVRGMSAGLSIAVVFRSDTLTLDGFGYADLELRVPATARTVYRIGSLTKQFTALAIMQLVERGRLSLEDGLTDLLPEFSERGNGITVRHLLTHTSGIKSYTELGMPWRSKIRLDLTRREMVELFKDEPLEFRPGTRYAYSNSGYFLLGMIIEEVSGQPYDEYLRQHVFRPLGLSATYYCDNTTIILHRAEGYTRTSTGLANDEPISMTHPFAAGALCSNVIDLLAWQAGLLQHRLIRPWSFEQMTTPATLLDGQRTTYGFGLGVTELDGHRLFAHGGGINGFNAYMAHLPDDSLTVIVLANTEESNPWDIARDIIRVTLGTIPPPIGEVPLSAEDRMRYLGYYKVGDLQLRVFERGDHLMAQALGQPAFELVHQGRHRFVAGYDHTVEIEFEVRSNLSVGLTLTRGEEVMHGPRLPERP